MNNKKQTTLFQSWGGKKQDKPVNNRPVTCQGVTSGEFGDLCDEDEDLLIAKAMEESLKDLEQRNGMTAGSCSTTVDQNFKNQFSDDDGDVYETISLCDVPQATAIEDLPGFDNSAGDLWIYPTNYPVREYQFSIVKEALYKNTMVVLPTGLGKTFIAAVVMYNFYRWYPQGKIMFMAPTKPLVAQQIEACYNIMGIPQEDTAEMTGAMNPTDRKRSWERKRVFFLTPQVLTNDLSRSACPAESVKCLVVDEAHKATGNHAYCQVVKELIKYNQQFRILALSATPGSDIKAVQHVLSNLLISHIELKSEDSPDIQQYSHERRVDKVVVPLGQELAQVKDKYLQIMTVVVNRLKRLGVLYNRDAKSFSKFLILKSRESFRQDPPPNMQRSQFGSVEGDFALAMSLYHGYDLLQQHGLRSLFNYLDSILHGEKSNARTRTELMKNADFREIIEMLTAKFKPVKSAHPDAVTPSQFSPMRASQLAKPFAVGHPKMEKLQEIVLEHFNQYKNDGLETRIMIFSQFRDSVNEITELLNRHRPQVKCMSFIGQSVGKSSKGFSQKDQLRVMKQFRDGGYNTLVSTCVGEEGLDIGDVDLIICFDAHKSPIRLVQRMGRTGRKRKGRIVMLVTEGKEEQIYNQSQYSKKSIHKAIQNGARSLHFYPNNPRMVPLGLTPSVHKMHITVHTKYNPQAAKGKAATSAPQKTHITGLLQNRGPRSKSRNMDKKDGFLTPQELEYWNENFHVDDKSVPTLPESEWLSLSKKDKTKAAHTKKTGSPHNTLSLSNWMPWQNRLQETRISGHSLRSNHMVEIMEFMDIQNTIDSGGDHYGEEMQMYLNEDDLIKPEEKKGILKYCTPEPHSRNKGFQKKQKRASTVLTELSSEEEEVNTEDELPGLHDVISRKDKQRKKSGDFVSPARSSISPKIGSHDQRMSHDQTAGPHVEPSTCRQRKKNPNHAKKETADVSLIQVIEDKDSQDFETDTVEQVRPLASSENDSTGVLLADNNHGNFDIDITEDMMPELPSLANIEVEQELMEVSEEENSTNVIGKNKRRSNTVDHIESDRRETHGLTTIDQEEELRLSELLPDFTGRQKAKKPIGRENSLAETVSEGVTCSVVRTPPSLEEVDLLIGELDRKGCLSPVDVLDLIDKWETERPAGSSVGDGVWRHSTIDAGCQTKAKGGKRLMSKSDAKVSLTTSSISVRPCKESSARVEAMAKELQNIEDGHRFPICKEVDVDGNTDVPLIGQKKLASAPVQSQVVRKPLFKKSPSPCIVLHEEEREGGSNGNTSTSLLGEVDAHDFSLPLTEEKAMEAVSFESYGGDILSRDVKVEKSSPANKVHADFVKASHLLVSPRIDRNNSCSSDDYSPTFDAPHHHRKSLPTSTPTVVKKSADLLKLTTDQLQDSFFNQEDDALFGNMKTPQSLQPSNKKTTICFQLQTNAQKFTETDKVKLTKACNNQSLNHTLITFTQALAFADESLNSSHSHSVTGSSHSSVEVNTTNTKNNSKSLSDCSLNNHSKNQSDLHQKQTLAQEQQRPPGGAKSESNKIVKKVETEDDFVPQFDLGFDFDDLEDMVPPSPVRGTQPFSQVSILPNKSGAAGNLTVERSSTAEAGVSPALIGGLGVKFSQKLAETSTVVNSVDRRKSQIKQESSYHDNSKLFPDDVKFIEEFSELLDKTESRDKRIESNTSEENTSVSILPQVRKHACVAIKTVDCDTVQCKSTSDTRIKRDATFSLFGVKDRSKTELGSSEDSTSMLLSRGPTLKTPITPAGNDVLHSDSDDNDSLLLLVPKHMEDRDFRRSSFPKEAVKNTISTPVARIKPQFQNNGNYSSPFSVQVDTKDSVDLGDIETLEVTAGDFEDSMYYQNSHRVPDKLVSSPATFRQDDVEADLNAEELDDSLIQVKRKKKSVALIATPDTPVFKQGQHLDDTEFKTPLKPAPRVKRPRQVISSDDEDVSTSPMVAMETKKRKTLTFEENFSDEDFEDFGQPRKTVMVRSPKRNSKEKMVTECKKKKKQRCGFIEEEAELSGDSNDSDDEDGSDLDHLDDSFVNDATQLTQGVEDNDMHAVYMRSIKSPEVTSYEMPERYRVKHNPDLNVFSQFPNQEEGESCYMEDSFVVGSDHEFGESEFVPEQTIMEAAILPTSRRRCTRNSHRNNVMLAKLKDKKLAKDGSRKRIKRLQHSSSSEDEGDRNVTVTDGKGRQPRLSSSGSEVSLSVHKSPELLPAKLGRNPNPGKVTDVISNTNSPSLSGYTQIPSLQTRCRKRIQNGDLNNTASSRSDSTVAKGSTYNGSLKNCVNVSSQNPNDMDRNSVKTKESDRRIIIDKVREQNTGDFQLTFDLGLDDLLGEDTLEESSHDHQGSSSTVSGSKPSSHTHLRTSIPTQSGRMPRNSTTSPGSSVICDSLKPMKNTGSIDIKPNNNTTHSRDVTTNTCSTTFKSNTTTSTSPMSTSVCSLSSSQSVTSSSPNKLPMSKEERLRLSKLKQEQFKKKYANKMERGAPGSDHVTILDNTLPSEPKKYGMYSSPAPNNSLSNITQTESSRKPGLVVYVDSREINGAQDVISTLRAKYQYQTEITQLQGCDYIISHRMAVERKIMSDFTNGANKGKLVDRLKQTRELFEKCVVLVEKDRLKQGEKEAANKTIHIQSVCKSCFMGLRDLRRIRRYLPNSVAITVANALVGSRLDYCNSLYRSLTKKDLKKLQCIQNSLAHLVICSAQLSNASPILKSLHWLPVRLKSKYVESMLASLCQIQVKVYFSESQENTAEVLAQLIDIEQRKGFAIVQRNTLTQSQTQLLKFYLSIPRVSHITALNFLHGYRTLKDFINSPVGILEKRGQINREKAVEIHRYVEHQFNPQMLGLKR